MTYENPSAGKFDPPPAPPGPEDASSPTGWRVIIAVLSSYPVVHLLLSVRGRGWLSVAAIGAACLLAVLHYVVRHPDADERSDTDPYSKPTHITR